MHTSNKRRKLYISLLLGLLTSLFAISIAAASTAPDRSAVVDLPICSYISSHVANNVTPDQHYWGDLIEMNYKLTGNTMGATALIAYEIAASGAPAMSAPITIPAIGDNMGGYGAFDTRGAENSADKTYEIMFVHYASGSDQATCRSNAHYVTLGERDQLSTAHEAERTKTITLPVCSALVDSTASTIDSPSNRQWGDLVELNYSARQSTSYSALVAFEIDRSGLRPNSKIIALPSIHTDSAGYGGLDTRTAEPQSPRNYEMMFVHYNMGEDTPACRSNSHHVRLIP